MRRARGLLFLVLVVVSVGTIDGLIPTVSTLQAAPPQRTIRMIQDLQYYDGPGAERGLHSFDLYLPEGKTNFPMLFFIHGGGWRGGDKVYDGLDKIAKICVLAEVMQIHNDMQPDDDEGGGAEAGARMDGDAIEVRFVPHHVRFRG